MRKANLNGAQIEYESAGSGEPVLLIDPGPIRDSFVPFFSAEALSERYRLIRYRQRRIGPMTGGAPVSFAQHAADAAALIDHLGIGRAHVVGHSTGASIALQLAVDRPEIVQTLALLEPPLMSAPSAGAFLEKVGPAGDLYEAGDRESAMATFLSGACSLDWETCRTTIENQVPGGVAQAMKDADNFFESYLPALNAWAFDVNDAATISRPVLSVLGTDSEQLFVDSHKVLKSWFAQIETCLVEGVAHLLHIQRPAPIAHCLAQFFANHAMIEHRAARGAGLSIGAEQ